MSRDGRDPKTFLPWQKTSGPTRSFKDFQRSYPIFFRKKG